MVICHTIHSVMWARYQSRLLSVIDVVMYGVQEAKRIFQRLVLNAEVHTGMFRENKNISRLEALFQARTITRNNQISAN